MTQKKWAMDVDLDIYQQNDWLPNQPIGRGRWLNQQAHPGTESFQKVFSISLLTLISDPRNKDY